MTAVTNKEKVALLARTIPQLRKPTIGRSTKNAYRQVNVKRKDKDDAFNTSVIIGKLQRAFSCVRPASSRK